jgi:hypothetical protein
MIDIVRRRVAITPPAVDRPVILGDDTSRVKNQDLSYLCIPPTSETCCYAVGVIPGDGVRCGF